MVKRVAIDMLGGAELSNQEMMFLVEYSRDCDARRAARAVGMSADSGYTIRDRPNVQAAYLHIVRERMKKSHIDADWVLYEAVDNHTLARQAGNLTASNTALNLIAKLASVDAFAAEKVLVASDKEVIERLNRGRARMNKESQDDDVSFI